MKISHLKQIVKHLQQYSKIVAIYRVEDTIIKIVFDKDETYYFDLKKGASYIFKSETLLRTKFYKAPFDVILAKYFNHSKIINITQPLEDKVIHVEVSQNGSYKERKFILSLEFTGKNTNAIIIDENNIIVEALRHIDSSKTYREVRPNVELLPLPALTFEPKNYELKDVNRYLYNTYNSEINKKLASLKSQKIKLLQKQLNSLEKKLSNLADEKRLHVELAKKSSIANIILANIHNIKPYSKTLELYDFEGNLITITLDKEFSSPSQMSQYYFNQTKKIKSRIENSHIEKDNLEQKVNHLRHFIKSVEDTTNISQINLLFPSIKLLKKTEQDSSIEVFFIDGYKVMLGKNERGNIALLKNAKARDIWLHLKDKPSTHVIIVTDKQNIPLHVIEQAAILCAQFSTFDKSAIEVDYTPRREVTIQNGANVLYNKYKTITVKP
ncbi:MAG: NFACT RNA binding domain-containing protein [Campylobacterota bacterium]|nr:NFACT RNA binding domain-containing protein [Campylobacterota bacterium]